MTERPDWDRYFMTLAYMTASRSLDPSTHVGAVIVRNDNSVLSTGYNNPVRDMEMSDVPTVRPDKYFFMEHAERNAIFSAAKNEGGIDGCRMYVTFLPCADCARAIVQSGISEVIVHREGQAAFDQAMESSWNASHDATLKILAVKYKPRTSLLRWWSGKLWSPIGFFRGKEFNL
jgi:dCMP deaminase